MPRSRARRQRSRDREAALFACVLLSLAGAGAWLRAWYLSHQARVDATLRWAVPAALALCVVVLCLLVRRRLREMSRDRRWRESRARAARRSAGVALPPAGTDEEGRTLPSPEYLYRYFGWWQDPDDPSYPDGVWHPDTRLYIGRSVDFGARNAQHEADSHWHPNVTGSTQEVFRSYVDGRGRVVTAREQLVAAERHAIETEHPKHNIVHNGALGQRERQLRAQIRAYLDQVA